MAKGRLLASSVTVPFRVSWEEISEADRNAEGIPRKGWLVGFVAHHAQTVVIVVPDHDPTKLYEKNLSEVTIG